MSESLFTAAPPELPAELSAQLAALRVLSDGSGGRVVLCQDRNLLRTVILKQAPECAKNNDQLVLRFQREARTLAALSHPQIVRVFDMGTAGGRSYILMENLEGGSLADHLDTIERMNPLDTALLGIQICVPLGVLHGLDILHRDLKTQNTMLDPTRGVVLIDFGICKHLADDGLTMPGSVLGTPHYLAPELILGTPASPRSDLYSLGIILYRCLAGQFPFSGRGQYELMAAHVDKDPPPIPSAPRELMSVIMRCLAKSPQDRYATATEVHDALSVIRDDAAPTATFNVLPAPPAAPALPRGPRPKRPPAPERARKRPVLMGLACITILLIGTLFRLDRTKRNDPLRQAEILESKNDEVAAEKCLRMALNVEPKNIDTRFRLTACLLKQGKEREAGNEERRCIDLCRTNPRRADSYIRFAGLFVELHRWNEAVRAFRAAFAVDPDRAPDREVACQELWAANRVKEAREMILPNLQLNPPPLLTLDLLTTLENSQDQPDDVIRYGLRAVATYPPTKDNYHQLLDIHRCLVRAYLTKVQLPEAAGERATIDSLQHAYGR